MARYREYSAVDIEKCKRVINLVQEGQYSLAAVLAFRQGCTETHFTIMRDFLSPNTVAELRTMVTDMRGDAPEIF